MMGTWSMYYHATIQINRGPYDQFQSNYGDMFKYNLQFYPGSLRHGQHLECYNCNHIGNRSQDFPYPCNGIPLPPPVAPDYILVSWSGTPPSPPLTPNPPPPPPLQPFTNHKAMIHKFGGAIWNSALNFFLPPITGRSIVPFMQKDPLTGDVIHFVNPNEECINSPTIITELTLPPQVLFVGEVINNEEVPSHSVVTSHAPRVRGIKNQRVQSCLTVQNAIK
jgi:hypothetical protein